MFAVLPLGHPFLIISLKYLELILLFPRLGLGSFPFVVSCFLAITFSFLGNVFFAFLTFFFFLSLQHNMPSSLFIVTHNPDGLSSSLHASVLHLHFLPEKHNIFSRKTDFSSHSFPSPPLMQDLHL